jgi:hypothetical protein
LANLGYVEAFARFFTCFSSFSSKTGSRVLQKKRAAQNPLPSKAVQPETGSPIDIRKIRQIIEKLRSSGFPCAVRLSSYGSVAPKAATGIFVVALTRQIYEFLFLLQTFRLLKKIFS